MMLAGTAPHSPFAWRSIQCAADRVVAAPLSQQWRALRRIAFLVVGVASLMLVLPSAAPAAPKKNVLILRGGAPDLPGGRIVIDQIEATLSRQFPGPVEFYIETIDPARFSTQAYESRLAELYAEAYGRIPLDLVVAFTGPAVDFVRDYRWKLFPHTPLLFGVIEPRFFDGRSVPDTASTVFVNVDPVATLRLARSTYPAMRRVLVVVGTSEFDRGWLTLVRRELRDFDPAVSVTYDVDSPVEHLIRTVASLPADTVVLYVSMTRDGEGQPARPRDVLQMLRGASHVPIYGLASTYLGYGIVGGALLDFDRHGEDLARQASRILSGGKPQQSTTPSTQAVDWRELQRFEMPLSNVPANTTVAYRDPGPWERYKWTVVTVLVVMIAQTALIVSLVLAVRRRRQAQRQLEGRLRFERLLSGLSSSLSRATADRIEADMEAGLALVAADLGIDCVWRLEFGTPEADGWDSPQVRAGHPAVFAEPSELPPGIRDKLAEAGCVGCSSVAVPLGTSGVVYGALFWASRRDPSSWAALTDELQMVASAVGSVLERKRAERALEQSDTLKGAILASLPAHVAVLDRNGTIIAVNDAWMEYGRSRGASSDEAISPGAGDIAACVGCSMGPTSGTSGHSEAIALIEAACRGERTGRQIEYSCGLDGGEAWFLMTVEPLRRAEGGAVVAHVDITQRKLNEIALRESENRFRRLADALPVAVWMSGVDAKCGYFNEQWLKLTGRSLDQEVGDGWLEGVHPDDRPACMETYLRAFESRQRFSMDYRIRRHDGEYRWLMDVGIPRFGSDGVFHGYVGGCVDVTERTQAEQMVRDLNRRLLVAGDEERRRIARELHDHLSQQIALLAIGLQTLALSPPDSRDELVAALHDDWQRTTEIASEVHALSHRLHPSRLEALGLVATIRGHCRDLSRQSIAVQFSEQTVPHDIPQDVALCLFRVTEEALSNVRRHSDAAEAKVTLTGEDSHVLLRVSDAGCGFAPSGHQSGGIGLVSMGERLRSLGGTLSIESAPGKGTVVEARVPLSSVPAIGEIDGAPPRRRITDRLAPDRVPNVHSSDVPLSIG